MEIRAYDDVYVSIAQNTLGHAVDFAISVLNIEPLKFGQVFGVSSVSKQFASGNPHYIAGMNGCELAREILNDTGTPFMDADDVMYLDKSPEYWAGWALAFYQWYSSRSFMDILMTVPLSRIIQMYPVFHEMDIMNFTEEMDDILKNSNPFTRLKNRRISNNLSQSQLATSSGVALRQIQLFEQRQRNINNAAAITLLKLSKALNCSIEDLMEYSK